MYNLQLEPYGEDGLFAYITKSIKYPSIAKENNITGIFMFNIIDKKEM